MVLARSSHARRNYPLAVLLTSVAGFFIVSLLNHPQPVLAADDHASNESTETGAKPLPSGGSDCGQLEVLFSPKGGCRDEIIEAINRAEKSVYIQAVTFSDSHLIRALLEARERGVDCELILDRSSEKTRLRAATILARDDISVLVDHGHRASNTNLILIDGELALVGSYSFTRSSETANAEHLMIIREMPEVFARFAGNYDKIREEAKPYRARAHSSDDAEDQNDEAWDEDSSDRDAAPRATSLVGRTSPTRDRADRKDASNGDSGRLSRVYVTKYGKKYHRPSCKHLTSTRKAINIDEAKRRGFGPCKVCRPTE